MVLKNTKLITNSKNAMCNTSKNYVDCVGNCKGVTVLLFLISIHCIKTRAHKLSRTLRATSKFYAPEW